MSIPDPTHNPAPVAYDDLVAAFLSVAQLLREEYPADLSLAEIVGTYGDPDMRQTAGLVDRVESVLFPRKFASA